MSLRMIFLTLLCVTGIAAGQLLFKKAAMALPAQPGLLDWVLNGWLIGAFALYGVTTLAWIWVLRHAPLHLAYPFMGLAFLIVPVLAWWTLGEPLQARTLWGGLLIAAGIALAAHS
jgi:drug/metabolite transporter (DMT)-like permease